MVDKVPFDIYDFFGYLASGLAILLGMEMVLGFPQVLAEDLTVVETAALILGAYVAGQCVAAPARLVLEDGLVDKVLKRPSVNLFRDNRPRVRRMLAPGYYQQLPENRRKNVLDRAEDEGVQGTGEGLFLHVRYSDEIRANATVMSRLDNFLAKYGFARNLGFTALVVGVAMLVDSYFTDGPNPHLTQYSVTELVAGLFLVNRYLKFFRQYSYEMFNTYAKGKGGDGRT
jgi:hypothetical protein